jgi:hypothetical protein
MEGGEPLRKGKVLLATSFDYNASEFEDYEAWALGYNAYLMQSTLQLAYGVSDSVELRLDLSTSTLRERSSEDEIYLFEGTTQYIGHEERHWGFQDAVLSLKVRLLQGQERSHSALSGALALRFPLSDDEDFLTTQAVDASVNLMATQKVLGAYLHANLGYVYTGDEDLFLRSLDIDEVITFGVGFIVPLSENLSFGAQLQGCQNAFQEIDVYDRTCLFALSGFKFTVGGILLELTAGSGLNEESGDLMCHFSVSIKF